MMDTGKFCLKWNDFLTNNAAFFQEMKNTQEFTDVTLVCEDNQRFEAHKLILSSASNFFKSVLTGRNHSHPLIYMRRVKFKHLESMLDFIYYGETKVSQEDINEFLLFAEELEMKGLARDPIATDTNYATTEVKKTKNVNEKDPKDVKEEILTTSDVEKEKTFNDAHISETKVAIPFPDENTGIDVVINSMLEKIQGIWTCSMCGKAGKDKYRAKRHIETTHIEGASHSCDHCGKSFRYLLCIHFD